MTTSTADDTADTPVHTERHVDWTMILLARAIVRDAGRRGGHISQSVRDVAALPLPEDTPVRA